MLGQRKLGVGWFLLVCSCVLPCLAAPSVWQRTRLAGSAEERETLRAIERVLGGEGEELDLLRVRTAIVELMREQTKNPRTVVLLFHLRRQLGLGPPQGGLRRLSAAMSSKLSHYDRALGFYELARLRLDLYWSEPQPAEQELIQAGLSDLQRGLDEAWEPRLRAEMLTYRALTAFRLEDYSSARADLSLVAALATSSASLRDAYLGLGLVDLSLGEQPSALRFFEWAVAQQQKLSSAAPLPAFAAVPLMAGERQAVAWTQEIAAKLEADRTLYLEPELCERLRKSDRAGSPSFARISQIWLQFCAEPAP